MATVKQGIYTNELFMTCFKDDVMKAQVIAKNLFCKAPDDIKLFNSYFSFCTGIVSKRTNNTIDECQFFLAEAELALRIFSEKCEINELSLKAIDNSNAILQKKAGIINDLLNEQQKQQELLEIYRNNKVFYDLCSQIKALEHNYTESAAEKIANLDRQLNKELLSEQQIKNYNKQSELLSETISQHLKRQSQYYNNKAMASYKQVIDAFIADSSYKKEKERDKLKSLLVECLFSYNQEKLLQETLIYYNYVYSYIFNKLDNEGKKLMTEWAINNK